VGVGVGGLGGGAPRDGTRAGARVWKVAGSG